MDNDTQFEKIREEIEAKQRSILWPDYLRANRNVFEFLWKGDPKAKPIQRAGLIVFGVMNAVSGFFWISLCLTKTDDWISRFFGFLIGLVSALVSIRLFRNAFLRQNAPHNNEITHTT
jgi:hypothetical protein